MALEFRNDMLPYALGRRVNMEEWNTITRTLVGTTPIGFGAPVQRHTNHKGCAPYTSGEVIGISEASLVLPHPLDRYEQYDNVAICEVGVIGVMAGEAVTAGDLAGWDPAANSGAGGWVTADTGAPAVPGAQFESSGSTGEVVALRYRRPVPTA